MEMKPIEIVDNPRLGKLCVFEKTEEVKKFIQTNKLDWVLGESVVGVQNSSSWTSMRWSTQALLRESTPLKFVAISIDTKGILNDIIND